MCTAEGSSALLLGQKRKTFLKGQRALALLPAIGDDGNGGASRGRGARGTSMGGLLFGFLTQLWLCPRLSIFSTHPVLLSFSHFKKLARVSRRVRRVTVSSFCPLDHPWALVTFWLGGQECGFPLSLPPRLCKSTSLVDVSHRASRCHPIPAERLRMEMIYWWPLCLFSLPLLLVLLSTLLSYLAAKCGHDVWNVYTFHYCLTNEQIH